MKKILALCCVWLIGLNPGQAQSSKDSVALLQTRWQIEEILPGVFWKSCHFNQKQLFGSNQNINVVETRLKNRRVRTAFVSADAPGDTSRRLVKTSELGAKSGALVAINGTFFDTQRGGSVDYIKIDGNVLDTSRYTPGKPLVEHQTAAVVIRGRKVSIERAPGGRATLPPGLGATARIPELHWERRINAPNVMVTGPLLLWNGQPTSLQRDAFNDNRHPRSAVCVTRDKKLLLVTADGRNAQAAGMTLQELTFVMRQLGCRDAVNLDGGGSTTLYLKDQPDGGVVNFPSDNKLFDHFGERPVSNAILLMRRR